MTNTDEKKMGLLKKVKMWGRIFVMLLPFILMGILLIVLGIMNLIQVFLSFIAWFVALFALFYVRKLIVSGKVKLQGLIPGMSDWWEELKG